MGKKPNPLTDGAEHFDWMRKLKKASDANLLLKSQLAQAMLALEAKEQECDTLLGLSDRENVEGWEKPPSINKGRAVALMVLSDIHCGEVVRPEQVLNLNRYDLRTCEKRVMQVAYRAGEQLKKERVLADIREGMVFLGGDLIGGKIHSDLAETAECGIATAVMLAEELCERAVRTFFNAGKFDKLTVVCLSGNHDRSTTKVQHASFVENSYATTIYRHLRFRFQDRPQIQFVIGEGEYQDVRVYDWNIRLTHGHRVRFAGGVGGLHIPWTKHVTRLNKALKADFTVGGHMHIFTPSYSEKYLVNGSVLGTTAYSLPLGHERPQQAFVVIDRKRCITQMTPLFCE